MNSGRLIAVVGPSGVGKDSVMRALAARVPALSLVRRAITRPPAPGSEEFDSVDPADFALRRASGGFCLAWEAHGLSYGIPADVTARVAAGDQLLVNLSRSVLGEAHRLVPSLAVLSLSARPETLARRLGARGREDAEAIARRLARPAPPPPAGVPVFEIANDGALAETVAAALAVLYPVRA